jgi:hypothetical protein
LSRKRSARPPRQAASARRNVQRRHHRASDQYTSNISSCLTTNIRFILSLSMYIYIIACAHAKKFEKICTPYNQVCAPLWAHRRAHNA